MTTTTKSMGRPRSVPPRREGLKPKFQVGSIKGRLNYVQGDTAFSSEHVPKHKQAMKFEVIRGSRPHILRGDRPWNQSSSCSGNGKTPVGNQISKYDQSYYRHNFRAEVVPKTTVTYVPKFSKLQFDQRCLKSNSGDKVSHDRSNLIHKRVEEAPVHPNLLSKESWNGSTMLDAREVRRRAQEQQVRCTKNSHKQQQFLLTQYATPKQREIENMARLREEKALRLSGKGSKANARSASATRNTNTLAQQNTRKRTNRKYKEYFNDGVWEYNEAEGCNVWSCSMNPNRDFRGSAYVVRNPDAWNFASP